MIKKYHFIYKTTNTLSGKYYFGMHSTNDLNDGYYGSGKRLRYSLNKYGKENHQVEILEFYETREDLKKREKEIVSLKEISKKDCMNLIVGGEGGTYTEEHLKLISELGNKAFLEKMEDPEYRKNYSKKLSESKKKEYENGKRERTYFYDWYGKNHSEETKKLLSKQRKGVYGLGKNNSVYGRKWMNKDGVKKMVKKEEIEEHTNNGWIFGKMKK
tara:strand:+ start:90 stop:734 length:645 start_codon:yes stop_codon:yes gene_type:complete